MGEPFESDELSFMEDLDPEQRPGKGLSYTREFAIGLILLLGVLGWSGYQWWDGQRMAAIYHSAEQALSLQDWDAAGALYASIPGYRDSSARAAQAARTIAERDTNYSQASAAAAKGEWLVALDAAQKVDLLQQGYADTRALIDRAQAEVYTAALSGTVALRLDSDTPGLYYRTSTGWTHLRGSGPTSRVQGIGPPGHIVYNNGSGSVMLATVETSSISYSVLNFTPLDYSFFMWGDKGVWALKYEYGYLPPQMWGIPNQFTGYAVKYQAYGSARTEAVEVFGGQAILDFSQAGDAILVGSVVYTDAPNDSLYVADATGKNRRLIYTGSGGLSSAHFSPDGRYVLALTYKPSNNYRSQQEYAMLIDLSTSTQTLLAARETGLDTGFAFPSAGATFVKDGPLAGRVILFEWSPEDSSGSPVKSSSKFTLLDPADPASPLSSVTTDSYPLGPVWVSADLYSPVVMIAWQDGLGGALPYADSMTTVRLSPGKSPGARRVTLGNGEVATGAWLQGGYAVFTARSSGQQARTLAERRALYIYSAHLNCSDPGSAKPTLLGTTESGYTWGVGGDMFAYGQSFRAGQGLLAYIDDGGHLHGHTYGKDNPVDTSLEGGITQIYNFPYNAINWLK